MIFQKSVDDLQSLTQKRATNILYIMENAISSAVTDKFRI